MLNGYKTYALAVLAVVYAVAAYYTGHISQPVMLQEIWAALTASALRHGISTKA